MTPLRQLEFCVVVVVVVTAVVGHSWNYHPTPRDYGLRPAEIDNEDVIKGCKYTRAEGWDMTYSRGGELARRVVSRGQELCVAWASNGHIAEPGRGHVRLSLSTGEHAEQDSQDDFDANIILANVDFAGYLGVRVLIPQDTPLGLATLQFHWDYCGANRFFVSCSDIIIVEKNDPEGHNLGLRGHEQDRYLGNCAAGMPPIPTSFPHPNNCPERPLPGGHEPPPPPPPPSESEEEDEEEPHECDCSPIVQNKTVQFTCDGVVLMWT